MGNAQDDRGSDENREWLEADRLGGFAMGTAVAGLCTRRYHGLLTVATTPPTGRVVLVNAVEAWLETLEGRFPLSTHRYGDGVVHPRGRDHQVDFRWSPWPTWTFRVPSPSGDAAALVHELFVDPDSGETVLRWTLPSEWPWCRLSVRPLLSGRDYHALHGENPAFRFDPVARVGDGNVAFRPYPDLPAVGLLSNGVYRHDPDWFRGFVLDQERARGLDDREDLASPGEVRWEREGPPRDRAQGDLADQETAVIVLRAGDGLFIDAANHAARLRRSETARRASFPTPLHRAADAYVVRRSGGQTVIAGFPWFTDWGRDAFIALRGLGIATGRYRDVVDLLVSWADTVSEGMVPNRFPDRGEAVEYNSVDASLWYVAVIGEVLTAGNGFRAAVTPDARSRLEAAVQTILKGCAEGTRFGIRSDPDDGLLACGVRGVQLTWMDAKVGDWVVTPRVGKPVEIQALWANALALGAGLDRRWAGLAERAQASFRSRFWDPERGWLADVIDVDHEPGNVDAALRPNQILAVGGLPIQLVDGAIAEQVVAAVEGALWTPLGLRSLAPDDPAYRGRYEGGVLERDGAYHQGTVWPWLIGPFVDAWLRVHRGDGDDDHGRAVRRRARARFLAPLTRHLGDAGLGHVSEIADGDPPHTPRGAPFQAWSVGELLRIRERLRADSEGAADPPAPKD